MSDDFRDDELTEDEETDTPAELPEEEEEAPEGTLGEEDAPLGLMGEDEELDAFGFTKQDDQESF